MRSAVLVLSGLLASCASVSERDVLYDRYTEYTQQLSADNLSERYLDFFSKELVGSHDVSDKSISDQLLFKNLMHSEAGHAEVTTGESGCLTVNGYAKENLPMAFSLAYSYERRQWLINALHIAYLNAPSDFSETAKCPSEFID